MFRSTRPGTSLLMSLGIIAIIGVVAITVSTLVVASIRDSANAVHGVQAYYAAEGALERAQYLALTRGGPGYSSSNTTPVGDHITATYHVEGRVNDSQTADGYSIIPSAGTGDAGSNCNELQPSNDPDDRCNWGKLKLGPEGTIVIPLYSTDVDGSTHNLFDSKSRFLLRIRTPNGEMLDMSRGDPAYANQSNTSFDDPIVTWEIDASDQKDPTKRYALLPYFRWLSRRFIWEPKTTIVTKSMINARAADHVVVDSDDTNKWGTDLNDCSGAIQYFLMNVQDLNAPCTAAWATQRVDKPTIKLTLVHSIENADRAAGNIPYLEYQVLARFADTPSDVFTTITAEGVTDGFKRVLQVKIPRGSGLLEYAIQQ